MCEIEKEAIEPIEDFKNYIDTCKSALAYLLDSEELAEYFFNNHGDFKKQIQEELRAIEAIKLIRGRALEGFSYGSNVEDEMLSSDVEAVVGELTDEESNEYDRRMQKSIRDKKEKVVKHLCLLTKKYNSMVKERINKATETKFKTLAELSVPENKNSIFSKNSLKIARDWRDFLYPFNPVTQKRELRIQELFPDFENQLKENFDEECSNEIFSPCNLVCAFIIKEKLMPIDPRLKEMFIREGDKLNSQEFFMKTETLRKNLETHDKKQKRKP